MAKFTSGPSFAGVATDVITASVSRITNAKAESVRALMAERVEDVSASFYRLMVEKVFDREDAPQLDGYIVPDWDRLTEEYARKKFNRANRGVSRAAKNVKLTGLVSTGYEQHFYKFKGHLARGLLRRRGPASSFGQAKVVLDKAKDGKKIRDRLITVQLFPKAARAGYEHESLARLMFPFGDDSESVPSGYFKLTNPRGSERPFLGQYLQWFSDRVILNALRKIKIR